MTVSQLIEKLDLTVFAAPDAQRSVSGGYVGDLLSWVMGRAQADEAWITCPTRTWLPWRLCPMYPV